MSLNGKWIEIFRAGDYPQGKFSPEDLDQIVAAYNPALHEAPLVVGHPADNKPAYGWVAELKREGPTLLARAKDVVPAFEEMVKAGLFKKRSASFYRNYPEAGKLYLRHVGFLGAQPPEVKGLKDVFVELFGEGDGVEVLEVEFAATEEEKEAQRRRAKRYGIAVKPGGNVTKPSEYSNVADEDFADPVNYRYPIDREHIRAAASYWGMARNREQYSAREQAIISERIEKAKKKFGIGQYRKKETQNFSEGGRRMSILEKLKRLIKEAEEGDGQGDSPPGGSKFGEAELQARVDAAVQAAVENLLANFEEQLKNSKALAEAKEQAEKRVKALERERAHERIVSFCETLKKEGRLVPAWEEAGIVKFIEQLPDTAVVKFSEAEGAQEISPRQWFMDFLIGLPKVVEFKELAPRQGELPDDPAKRFLALTHELMRKEKIDFAEALSRVQREQPELAEQYLAARRR
jgi:hypothetical protein